MRKAIAVLILCAFPGFVCSAAIGPYTQWDVGPSGSDSNGGGFDHPTAGGCGTDESQQNSGTAVTIVAAGTTGTSTPAFTSTTHGPCNFINISGGTGCTVGVYELLSQSSGTGTFSSSMGTGTCTGILGGRNLTVAQPLAQSIAGNMIWVMYGTYTPGATLSQPNSGDIQVYGYNAAHGDITQPCSVSPTVCPTIATSTNAQDGWDASTLAPTALGNINFTTTAGTSGYGVLKTHTNGYVQIYNCTFTGFLNAINGDNVGSHFIISYLYVTQTVINNSTSYGIVNQNGINISYSLIENSGNHGIFASSSSLAPVTVSHTVFYKNGAKGIDTGTFATCDFCAFDQNTGDGFYTASIGNQPGSSNSIYWGNGGYGINYAGTQSSSQPPLNLYALNNAFGSNTSGAASPNWTFAIGIPNTTVTLTANPFVSDSTGNFALNSTSGGGALQKATGFPGVAPFGTGYSDIGPLQHQTAAASYSAYAFVQ